MSTLKSINVIHPSGTTNNIVNDASGNVTFGGTITAAVHTSPAATALTIQSAGTTAMTVGTNQNIGIGGAVSSDTTYKWLTLTGPTTSGGGIVQVQNSDASVSANFFCNNLAGYIGTGSSHPLLFRINSSEVARLDGSGNLLVGTTLGYGKFFVTQTANNTCAFLDLNSGVASGNCVRANINTVGQVNIDIEYQGVSKGTIVTNGTLTTYNTTSDYRLKKNVSPMTTGLATISSLKPVTYDWISDNSTGEGFIAHELQSVIPYAVTGDKDAVDEDGNPRHQGVDYSKIVVHLVAAIQELSAKNDALEARLAALEAK